MIQVQLEIVCGNDVRIQCNLFEREDCTEPERELAHAVEGMVVATVQSMSCPTTVDLIGEYHKKATASLEAQRDELLEACEAEEYSIAANGEYYRQCDLGEAPSEGWARLTFDVVCGARNKARDLRRSAIAKARGETGTDAQES